MNEVGVKKSVLLFIAVILFISAAPDQSKPNFLLVTIDTWRSDYISASGCRKVQTPFIDKLAGEGSYIKRVDTPSPITTPAHASILTGLYPINHGIRDNSHFRLKDNIRTMAQLFKDSGFKTIAVISGAPLKRNYGLDRGFDVYDDEGLGTEGVEGDDGMFPSSRDARKSAERALESAGKTQKGNVFIWLHLYDPHYPYTPPGEFLKKYPQDPYAGEVAYVDKVLGDFVPALMAGNKVRWIILVTGDHGEGLGENSEETHGFLLYKQTREVPLILWDSERKMDDFGTGAKSLIDIYPTVVELFSFQKSGCDGVSLFKNTSASRWLFSETLYPTMSFGANPAFLARKDDEICIRHGTSMEVYQGADEKNNLCETRKVFAAAAAAELKKFFGDGHAPSSNLKLTDEETKALASLGYIGSSQVPQKISSCDLREFSKDFTRYFSRGNRELAKGDLGKALFYYDMMIKEYPNSSVLHFDKGGLFVEMKRFSEAKEEFRTCLELDPRSGHAMLNLGNIMMMEGKPAEAEKFYLSSLSCEEDQALVHLNLGILYSQNLKNNNLAIKHLRRFLELCPDYAQRNNIENQIRALQNSD
jgi:arylsulfatase A-like enzyme